MVINFSVIRQNLWEKFHPVAIIAISQYCCVPGLAGPQIIKRSNLAIRSFKKDKFSNGDKGQKAKHKSV
jgi:hypothetical protein